MFKHKRMIVAIIALVLVVGVLGAEAGVTFGGGAGVGGGSVIGYGKVAGCGNQGCDRVEMHVVGYNMTAWCQNKGGNVAPGQETLTVDSNFSADLSVVNNGSQDFFIQREILPTAQQADCPNGNWSVIDLTGPMTVTLSAYAIDQVEPAAVLVFDCEAVFGVATDCVEVQ